MAGKPSKNRNSRRASSPGLFSIITEAPRIVGEFCVAAVSSSYIRKNTPKGDGHTVMVVPGFLAGDGTTSMLRGFLNDHGYEAVGWEQGRNKELRKDTLENFEARIKELYEEKGEKISLVGQSLGGVLSLIAASRNPQYVRSVTTLGSPIQCGEYPEGVVNFLRRYFCHLNSDEETDKHIDQLSEEISPANKWLKKLKKVPVTAIYSKGDGIVGTDIAVLPKERKRHQNVDIAPIGSHVGMGVNSQVFVILADRLAADPESPGKFNHNDYLWAFPGGLYDALIGRPANNNIKGPSGPKR
jgi:pimeloyl-ACP methyl ester carboxylesterase